MKGIGRISGINRISGRIADILDIMAYPSSLLAPSA